MFVFVFWIKCRLFVCAQMSKCVCLYSCVLLIYLGMHKFFFGVCICKLSMYVCCFVCMCMCVPLLIYLGMCFSVFVIAFVSFYFHLYVFIGCIYIYIYIYIYIHQHCISPNPHQHSNLQRGLLQTIQGKHSRRFVNHYSDPLGRWTSQSLRLKNDKILTTITAYRPCQKLVEAGSSTKVTQESTIY